MAEIGRVALIGAALICMALAAADYAWWRGFNDGADTMLCVEEITVDGDKAAMTEHACQHIRGKKPPVDLFGLKAP